MFSMKPLNKEGRNMNMDKERRNMDKEGRNIDTPTKIYTSVLKSLQKGGVGLASTLGLEQWW